MRFSEAEKDLIRESYANHQIRGIGTLRKLSLYLRRPQTSISRLARSMGLTNKNRPMCKTGVEKLRLKAQKWHEANPHPKGMQGKTHSLEFREKLSASLSNRWKSMTEDQIYENRKLSVKTRRENNRDNHSRGSWKSAWREIGGKRKFFRSKWEANYARYLEYLKCQKIIADWLHEPETFWFEGIKRGCVSYLPDYKVLLPDGSHYWVEVKGYMDDRSKTKIKRFEKYFPKESLKVIDGTWFKKNNSKLRIICPNWE
jgi:hypothetical protein